MEINNCIICGKNLLKDDLNKYCVGKREGMDHFWINKDGYFIATNKYNVRHYDNYFYIWRDGLFVKIIQNINLLSMNEEEINSKIDKILLLK